MEKFKWANSLPLAFALVALSLHVDADKAITLGNDPWPPFIIPGDPAGTAEAIVCGAMIRSGWRCDVKTMEWISVLEAAEAGRLDGIAAAWKSSERLSAFWFSEPYLTNRIVPVVRAEQKTRIASLENLAGLTVALVDGFAYGESLTDAEVQFDTLTMTSPEEAMQAVSEGRAQVALIDELIMRSYVESHPESGVVAGGPSLFFRELHLAVSRQHPEGEQIVEDFNSSFHAMLQDGTINEILQLDWLVTDLGRDGDLDLVLRHSVSPGDLDVLSQGSAPYPHLQSHSLEIAHPEWQKSGMDYHANGVEHDSLSSALDSAFGKRRVCDYEQWTSHVVCVETRSR